MELLRKVENMSKMFNNIVVFVLLYYLSILNTAGSPEIKYSGLTRGRGTLEPIPASSQQTHSLTKPSMLNLFGKLQKSSTQAG